MMSHLKTEWVDAHSRLWAHNSHSVGYVVLGGPSTVQHQATNRSDIGIRIYESMPTDGFGDAGRCS